jgi:hypothetical protein
VLTSGVQSGNGKVVITYPPLTDTTAPTTTINLSPASPSGQNGWYTGPVTISIAAIDPDDTSGIQTHCVLDPASVPSSFVDLPTTPCAYLGAGASISQGGAHAVYAASEDKAGNVESPVRSTSFKIDMTAPTAKPIQSPAANAAGWNDTDVTVAWSWGDNPGGSGIDPSHCTQSSGSTGEGTLALSATCQDLADNQSSASYTVKVDKTAPTVAASATKADGTAYAAGTWTNQTVTVHFGCQDALSGVATCPADQVFSADGVTPQASGTATDNADNQASAGFGPVQVDKTAPTISAAATGSPNANGWYNGNVTVHFSCADALSGIPTGACPADQTLSTEGSAVTSTAQTVQDLAGNSSAASNIVTVAIDKTAPTVSVTGVSNGASYTLGNVPTAGCTTTDGLSGVAASATLQVSGGTASGVGSYTAACTGAQDKAGNSSSASATYAVGYSFGGFLAPVNNPPTVNTGKAGRTYPVKFQLTSVNGAYVSSLSAIASVTYKSTGCGTFTGDPTDALETSATGGTSLRYDSSANQFVYDWATPSAGCYTLFLTLDSGQVFQAYFLLQ